MKIKLKSLEEINKIAPANPLSEWVESMDYLAGTIQEVDKLSLEDQYYRIKNSPWYIDFNHVDEIIEDENKPCPYAEKFMKNQDLLFRRHLNAHKYYKGLPSISDGYIDLIKQYSWALREITCLMCRECPEWKTIQHDYEEKGYVDVVIEKDCE